MRREFARGPYYMHVSSPYSFYIQVYVNWMNFFINLFLPLLVLGVLNVCIYRNMPRLLTNPVAVPQQQLQQQQQQQTTATSASVAAAASTSTTMTATVAVHTASADSNNGQVAVHECGGTAMGVSGAAARVASAAAAAKRKEEERDTRYTRAAICMVIVFLICHVPRFASNVFELVNGNVARQPAVST